MRAIHGMQMLYEYEFGSYVESKTQIGYFIVCWWDYTHDTQHLETFHFWHYWRLPEKLVYVFFTICYLYSQTKEFLDDISGFGSV
jgi:hypothetical protein